MRPPPHFFQGADPLLRAKVGWTQRSNSDRKLSIGAQRLLRRLGNNLHMLKKP